MQDFWDEDLTPEETEALLDRAAAHIRKRRLETPAILALEMHKPLSGIASHAAIALAPFAAPFLGFDAVRDISRLLRDRANVERLVQRLECPVEGAEANGERWDSST
jgi:acyl-CoA reductase-like NAD-dependent aldehyde dehydrogenase